MWIKARLSAAGRNLVSLRGIGSHAMETKAEAEQETPVAAPAPTPTGAQDARKTGAEPRNATLVPSNLPDAERIAAENDFA